MPILIILWVLLLIVLFSVFGFYNSMIWLNEQIKTQYAQVQNVYERRVDLVPQVASVVKNYASYESETLKWIVELRESSNNLEQLQQMIKDNKSQTPEFNSLLWSTLSQIKITMEAYPELKADTQFSSLIVTLEWSENRIRTEIKTYNDLVWSYNIKLKSFPWNMINWFFNFKEIERITPPEDKDIKSVPNVDNLLDTKEKTTWSGN